MSSTPSPHVSWAKFWTVVAIFAIPGFAGIVTLSRGAQTIIDNQNATTLQVNDVRTDIKSIKEKQTEYHEADIKWKQETEDRLKDLERRPNIIPWHPKPGYIIQKR